MKRQLFLDLSKIALTLGSAGFGFAAVYQHLHGNPMLALWYVGLAIWLEPKT